MKIKISLYLCCIVSLLFLILLGYKSSVFYNSIKEECEKDLRFIFRMAAVQEVDKRFADNMILIYRDDNAEPDPEGNFLVSEKGTIQTKRTEEYLSWSIEEKYALSYQTILVWKEVFLNVDDLNDIWNENLRGKNIYMKTGVKYRHRDFAETVYSSNADSLFFVKANRLDEYYTGILRDITLQGYYETSFKTIFMFAPVKCSFYIVSGISLIILLVGSFYYIFKSTRLRLKHLAPLLTEEKYLMVKQSMCYPLSEDITLDMDRGLLVSEDGREVPLTYKMIELLEQFICSPYFHVLNVDLWKNIWNREEDPSNVLTQLIRNLRKVLKLYNMPEVELRNVRRKGYRLIIHNKGKKPHRNPDPEDDNPPETPAPTEKVSQPEEVLSIP